MSDWSKPTTTSNYSTEFIQQLDARLKDLAYGLDPTYVTSYTGLPTNSIRWNISAANPKVETYNGTVWAAVTKVFALTATASSTLATARNLVLAGDVSGTVSFNGSANVTTTATLTSVNATTTTVGSATTVPVLAFDSKGRVTSVGSVAVSSTIGSSGAINGADITLKTGTGDTTLARIQTNAAGTLLYLGNGTTIGTFSPDAGAATLQNKIFNLTNNTLSGSMAQFQSALSDDDFVFLSTAQSLTSKTLSTGCSWNGNTLLATYGGTGQTAYAVGDLLYANTTTTLAKLADVATGNVLRSGGVGVAPAWGKVNLTTDITGVLPQANGGFITTGLTGILYANNGAASTVATAAQIVSTLGATYVTNASYATTAGTATSSSTATSANSASAHWYSANINGSATGTDISSATFRNVSGTGADNTACAVVSFLCTGQYGINMHLRPDGYFGIGGWSRGGWIWYTDPSNNMYSAGNVQAYSDPRLKENFKRIESPLSILNSLDGGTFNWKYNIPHIECKAGKKDYGVLADQVEKVMPEIVTESIELEGKKYKTVAYEKLVPVLIEAIKELNSRIAYLEAR